MNEHAATLPRLRTLAEAMACLGVSRTTVNKLLRDGELAKVKIYGAMRITEESIMAYIDRNLIPCRKGPSH